MDILKTGIGLRGYNQKDPLTEYKKESYEMFMDLISRIKHESTKTLQLIQLRDESEEKEREAAMAKMMAEMEEAAENVKLSHGDDLQPEAKKIEKKIARNEPCPCGSGKKYKNCCGKSGPKKGLLAK
jgi:preprotein translocase subunit SecA